MAYNKSLELKKIKPEGTYLGLYLQNPNEKKECKVRGFGAGAIIKSRDGKTEYKVMDNGEFRKIAK